MYGRMAAVLTMAVGCVASMTLPAIAGHRGPAGTGCTRDVSSDPSVSGDGVTNDAAAIQAILDAAPDGCQISFGGPGHTYLIDTTNSLGLTVTGKRLDFVGTGATLVRGTSQPNSRIASFQNCSPGELIEGLNFNINGVQRFGGIHFVSCDGISIQNNHVSDPNPDPGTFYDHYGFVVLQSNNTQVTGNTATDAELLEADCDHGVSATANTITRPRAATAIGAFAITSDGCGGGGYYASGYDIERNTIIDPEVNAITARIDASNVSNASFTDFTISSNRIEHQTVGAWSYSIGIGDFTGNPGTNNTFDGFTIAGNTETTAPALLPNTTGRSLWIYEAAKAGVPNVRFNHFTINGNQLGGSLGGWNIRIHHLDNSQVLNNTVTNVANGMALVDWNGSTANGNQVQATTTGYTTSAFVNSTFGTNNVCIGTPTSGCVQAS